MVDLLIVSYRRLLLYLRYSYPVLCKYVCDLPNACFQAMNIEMQPKAGYMNALNFHIRRIHLY